MFFKNLFFFIFFSYTTHLFPFFVGNPASPNLFKPGLVIQSQSWLYFKAGYLYDNIYKGRFKDEIITTSSTPTYIKVNTQAAVMTFTVLNWWDIYGVVGGSTMEFDNQIFTGRRNAWSFGSKLLLYKYNNFYIGLDGKYFYTNQKPEYILSEKQVYSLVTSFCMRYEEWQIALGVSGYIMNLLSPYAGVTFLYSTIKPIPLAVIVKEPKTDNITSFDAKASIGRKQWGAYLGVSIISTGQINLNLETRFFDQNAFNISGEFRF